MVNGKGTARCNIVAIVLYCRLHIKAMMDVMQHVAITLFVPLWVPPTPPALIITHWWMMRMWLFMLMISVNVVQSIITHWWLMRMRLLMLMISVNVVQSIIPSDYHCLCQMDIFPFAIKCAALNHVRWAVSDDDQIKLSSPLILILQLTHC